MSVRRGLSFSLFRWLQNACSYAEERTCRRIKSQPCSVLNATNANCLRIYASHWPPSSKDCGYVCSYAVYENKDKAGLLKGTPNIYWVWPLFSVCPHLSLAKHKHQQLTSVFADLFLEDAEQQQRHYVWQILFLGGVQVHQHYVLHIGFWEV